MSMGTDKRITRTEAARAIYVDIEKLQNDPPSLVGILCDGTFEQIVVDERLHAAAEAKGLRVTTFPALAQDLIRRCRAEDRRIVAFTQSESEWFQAWADVDLSPWYADARKIGKRWVNTHHRGALRDWSLAGFAGFLGLTRPNHLKSSAATRLRAAFVRPAATWESRTPCQKGKWTKLLGYNRLDCEEMRELTVRAAEGLGRKAA